MKPVPVLAPALATTIALLLTACGSDADEGRPTTQASADPSPGAPSGSTSPAPGATRPARVVGTVARGLEAPWGLDFLPDGSALVTERDSGRVLRVRPGTDPVEVGRIRETVAGSEAGLLGLAVSPDFATDRRVFVYASTGTDNRVLRMRLEGGRLGDPTAVLTGIPRGAIHDGGRLEFGPDGFLYVSTGETGDPGLAQDRGTLAGKILRITQDGAAAPGNGGSRIWSLGHRNVQGLAFDDAGTLWASEFGQDTWDELNRITRGGNYGWPEVEGKGGRGGYRDPQLVWRTEDASPSGLAFVDGHLWMASLRGERLWRVRVQDGTASRPTAFFVGAHGRMRTVAVAPDGRLWVTTSNRDGRGDPQAEDDRILLVDPGTS